MKKKMGVLIIEDSENDTLLEVKQLERLGYNVDYLRVESGMELRAALEKQEWDVVLSDFVMPHFSGNEALEIVRKKSKYLPFIFVSGMIGEDRAVEAMRNGANDYVLKDNLKRLGPSIERELRDTQLRIKSEKAEEELHESEKRYRTLVTFLLDALYVHVDSRIAFVNPTLCQLLGADDPSQLIGKSVFEIVHPEYHEKVRERWNLVFSGQPVPPIEEKFIRLDGSVVDVEVSAVAIDWQGSKGIQVIARDITERNQAAEKIREQADLLNESHDAISVLDLKMGLVFWNRGAEELYGWKALEVFGKSQWQFFVERPAVDEGVDKNDGKTDLNNLAFIDDAHRSAFTCTLANGRWEGELHQKTRSGKEVIVLSRWTLIRDKGDRPKSILLISTDITEQKSLEVQYRRTQRMEILGSLASGIAHDLNNVLTPITLGLETLQRKYADDQKTIRLLSTLESTINRGTGVVKQILTFARGSEVKRAPLELAAVVEDMKRIIEDTFPKSITADVNVQQGTWLILGDKTQIQQVLMNLCVNARDAMPEGGRLTISAKSVVIDESYAKMSKGVKSGDYVMVQVSDTGTGIEKENLEKLFEPFFTTKESEKGTGLGLSIVQGIVKGHGGFIEVESELNKGTTFKVYLPLVTPQEAPLHLELDVKPQFGQGELIIIVDDEAAIREITKSTLEAYGYTVLDAEDGSEAVALFVRHSNKVALVLTDIVMPIMDGVATIHALRKLNPDLKIIATTAYSDTSQHGDLQGTVNAVLKKPYTAATLMNCITQVLAHRPEKS